MPFTRKTASSLEQRAHQADHEPGCEVVDVSVAVGDDVARCRTEALGHRLALAAALWERQDLCPGGLSFLGGGVR